MKPRNFPLRKLRRQAGAKWRSGDTLTEIETKALAQPKDIEFRVGKNRRDVNGLPL